MEPKSDEYRHAVAVLQRLADVLVDTIREAADTPLGGVPCGTLYSVLRGTKLTMDASTFEHFIEQLVAAGRITHEHHLCKAVPN